MQGVIRKREVLAHPFLTIRSFGWPLFVRVLTADRQQTFLSLVAADLSAYAEAHEEHHSASIIDDCAELELRAQRIYLTLAARFGDHERAHRFFHTVAVQEHHHYELLSVCRTLAENYGWNADQLAACRESITSVSRTFTEIEQAAARACTMSSTLEMVVELEATEINHNFTRAVDAVSSPFIRGMRVFHHTSARHVAFVCDRVAMMAPPLAGVCTRLKEDAAALSASAL